MIRTLHRRPQYLCLSHASRSIGNTTYYSYVYLVLNISSAVFFNKVLFLKQKLELIYVIYIYIHMYVWEVLLSGSRFRTSESECVLCGNSTPFQNHLQQKTRNSCLVEQLSASQEVNLFHALAHEILVKLGAGGGC